MTTRKMLFQLSMGALSTPIAEQLERNGYAAPQEKVERWQRQADAITDCWLADLLTASMVTSARKKLVERTGASVERAP